MKQYFLLLHIFLALSSPLIAQEIFPNGGSGSYRLNYPGWNYAHHIYAPIGDNTVSHIYKGPNYQGPLQTHQWWTSALWDRGNLVINDGAKTITDISHNRHSGVMHPFPYLVEAVNEGFIFRHGFADVNGGPDEVEIHSAVIDARVGLFGQSATETRVDGYGDWHAVFLQNYGGGNTLKLTAASGCPFAFFQRTGSVRPTIYGLNKNVVTKSTSGNSFIFQVAPEGRNIYIGVFFPAGTGIGDDGAPFNPITALGTGGFGGGWDNMVFDMPVGSNYFSVSVMSDISQATLDLYEARAFNFITQTVHSYSFNEANSTLTTNFDVTTTNVYGGVNNGTLQALYKHQWNFCSQASGAANTGISYRSPRGDMRVLATNNFSTVMTHYGLLPNLGIAHTYNPVQMQTYIDNFMATVNIPANPADGYNKDAFVELGTIAQIASQIGHTTAKNKALNALEQRLTNWFTSPVTEDWAIFVYSNDFNFLAHYPNGFTSSGEFIDQHFHVAYMIYGAAILARYRPAWAAQYGDMVETVIRQINDYRKDMAAPGGNIGWFPYLRFFDPYAGHSWADPAATNQESVSEALTFAYGTFLWGETTGDNNIRDLGALLYITESEAGKLYWFDVDENINFNWQGGTYPQHHVTILRNRGGSYATFFSADNRWKHSIVILPQTAGTLWMVWDSTRAETMYSHLPAGGYTGWDEHGYHYNYLHAGFDGEAARNAFNAYAVGEQWINPGFAHVNGDIPQLYQWAHTFDSVGVYDNTVQADITGFSVFRKDTCKHYMVYIPPGKGPKNVNFTDGQSFNVPDDTVIVYKVCESQLPVTLMSFTGRNINDQYIRLNWATSSEYNSLEYIIERSSDAFVWEEAGWVNASGNSNDYRSYELDDFNPFNGINYYRIKQVDRDGAFVYSKVVAVRFGEGFLPSVSIYPNPVKDYLSITLSDIVKTDAISFKDVLGKSYKMTSPSGNEEIRKIFDVSDLPGGMYIIEIPHDSGTVSQIRFVKM